MDEAMTDDDTWDSGAPQTWKPMDTIVALLKAARAEAERAAARDAARDAVGGKEG